MKLRAVPAVLPLVLVAVLIAALGAACTTKSNGAAPGATETPSGTSAAFPVTVTSTAGRLTLAARPVRIVSLSPTLTEDLFAIGAGPQVVAVDKDSNYPAGAPVTSLDGFTPNLEAIAGYRPDLVLVSEDTKNLVSGLKGLSIPTLLEPAAQSLEDTYAQITQLGAATGHATGAASLIQTMKSRIQALLAKVPRRTKPLTYFYELDQTLYTVTSHTFVGSLFTAAGLKDVADPAGATSDYPQLNAETLLADNPDFIFLADTKCCAQSAATVAARPGYSTIAAVQKGHVVALDDDVASRWGPRVPDLLSRIVEAITNVPTSG